MGKEILRRGNEKLAGKGEGKRWEVIVAIWQANFILKIYGRLLLAMPGEKYRETQLLGLLCNHRTICAYQHQFGELSSDPKYIRDTGKDEAVLK